MVVVVMGPKEQDVQLNKLGKRLRNLIANPPSLFGKEEIGKRRMKPERRRYYWYRASREPVTATDDSCGAETLDARLEKRPLL